ncbi:hypothetical protein FR5810_02516 [Bordetella pertussis]|nr:hypothetical protein FR5810_02516 [Bordetella pertussis]
MVLLLIWARAGRQSIIPTSWRLHVWRNLSGVTSMWLGFFALAHLPLATATSLNYTAPLFIACWMLGGAARSATRCASPPWRWAFWACAVLRPSVNDDQWLAALLGLTAGAMSAIAMLQIRQLGRVGEPEWRTVLFFSVAVCASSGSACCWEGGGRADLYGYLALFGVGTSGLVGQLTMTRAFGHGSALLTAALQYTTIIFAAFIGMGLWGDALDNLAWMGMGLIIFAGLLSVWRTMRRPGGA